MRLVARDWFHAFRFAGRSTSKARSRGRLSMASKAVVGSFDRAGAPIWYSRGESIFGEKEPSEYLYKVKSGCVRTYNVLDDGRRQISSFYFPGDVFGLEVGEGHSISAEAVTRCNLYVTGRNFLVSRASGDCVIAADLLEITSAELQRTQAHLFLLLKTAQERVVGFLLEMEKYNDIRGCIDLPMPRQDIADYLGLTIETVSRVLGRLENTCAISMPTSRRIVLSSRLTLNLLD